VLRAFIQLGGFTFGKTASFYDFFNTAKYTYQTNYLYQDFGYNFGVFTYGYTQQLGNGFAATIAVQDPSPYEHNIVDLGQANAFSVSAVPSTFSTPTNSNSQNAGTLVPDIVGSIHLDQAWGMAQIAGMLHDDRARYYNGAALTGLTTGPALAGVAHPGDRWGWAVMGGIEINLPWAKGDSAAVQSQYCVGDSGACYFQSSTRFADLAWSLINVNKIGLGWSDDAYMANTSATGATDLQLATMWNIFGAIQHYWVPEVHTSVYGSYTEYEANSSAVDTIVCQGINAGHMSGVIGTVSSTGSRTIWNPVKNLDVGADVLYTAMSKTAFDGATVTFSPGGNAATGTFNVAPTHIWAGILRVQYNFYP
jgi:Porin subfamily